MAGKTKKSSTTKKEKSVQEDEEVVISKPVSFDEEDDPMDAMEEPKNTKKKTSTKTKEKVLAPAPPVASKEEETYPEEKVEHDSGFTIPILPAIHFHTYSLPALKKLVPTIDNPELLFKYLKQAKKIADANPQSGTHATKIRVLEKRITELIDAGKVIRERRIPGTGKQVEREFVYAKNAENKLKKREGTTYKKLVWEGCQYEKVPVSRLLHKKRRHRDAAASSGVEGEEPVAKKTRAPTAWIRALKQARADLGVGKQFVPVCNPAGLAQGELSNPTDIQKLGIKLYELARKYQDEIKRSEVKEPEVVSTKA